MPQEIDQAEEKRKGLTATERLRKKENPRNVKCREEKKTVEERKSRKPEREAVGRSAIKPRKTACRKRSKQRSCNFSCFFDSSPSTLVLVRSQDIPWRVQTNEEETNQSSFFFSRRRPFCLVFDSSRNFSRYTSLLSVILSFPSFLL